MATTMIERRDGTMVPATYVRHLRTLTDSSGYGGNQDVDLYRLADGTEIACASPDSALATPEECDPKASDSYVPGYH